MGPPCVEGQSPRECSLPPMLGPGGGPACPPPVTGSNTRVFTRQAVISLHTDPVRAAESPTHPTCPGLPSDFCLSCCSFQNSIIKSGIKMGNSLNISLRQGCINKLVHPCREILPSNKKENKLLTHTKNWMNLKCIMLRERSQTQKLWESIYMRCWKKQNYRDRIPISGYQGL